jgi:hypothetical protein
MKRVVRVWLLIGGFALLLALVGLVLFSGRHLASLSAPAGFSLFSQSAVALAGVDGNQFYEERCVDVSQYYALGYKNSSLDSHGCQLVSKTPIINLKISYGSSASDYFCQVHLRLGSSFYYCGYSSGYVHCCSKGVPDVKGGFERVLNTCTFVQNDLLVAESFAGGQSITKASLRYPIKSFCRAHPSIVTDDITKTSVTSTNIPQDLIDGKSVSISGSQTLTVFYVIENNYRLPTLCDSGRSLALDVDANTTICKSTLGFTYLCSEGQFDALSGTCVVQPESKTVCAQGRFDVGLGLCVYNPPLQVDCGSNDCFYSVDRDVCSCYVGSEFVCPVGFTLHEPTQSECVASGGSWLLCPQCPVDKVCASDICVPSCDRGTLCVMESPSYVVCVDANATIRDGECVVNGETIVVCPEGQSYNRDNHNCELKPSSITVCNDGSVPVKNSLTGVEECIASPPVFHSCDEGLMYDSSRNVCVESIQAFDPLSNDFVVYKEVQKDCTKDSDCSGIADGLVCNTGTGFCQTPVYLKSSTNYWAIGLGIVVLGLLILLLGKKKTRRRR